MSETAEQNTLIEIDDLTTKLEINPNNFSYVCRLASLHLDDGKIARSKPHADHALALFKEKKSPTLKQATELADMLVKFWKHDRFSNKVDLRINLSEDRKKVLVSADDTMKIVLAKKDSENANLISLKMSYVKEIKGEFQPALALLSDLIAAQATDNVDLSYIIFKAAIILKHIGQPKQTIEYLDFIMDDPPVQDGFSKTHVAAFLTHTYETSGEKYKVFLPKAYKDLQEAIAQDMPAAYSKLMRSLGKGQFSQSSEIWEILALQALERCEYVLAAQFLSEAILKAPGKAKLLHLLAEVYTLLKQKEQAIACAEEAYALTPQSSELRNLLLRIAPAVWTEKLRVLTATTSIPVEGEEEDPILVEEDPYAPPNHDDIHKAGPELEAVVDSQGQTAYLSPEKDLQAEEGGWLSKMKNKASGALKAINNGTPLINAKSPGPDHIAAKNPHTGPAVVKKSKEKEKPQERRLEPTGPPATDTATAGIAPFSPGKESHDVNQSPQEPPSVEIAATRPKSRGFVSMLYSSASAAASAAGSAATSAAQTVSTAASNAANSVSSGSSKTPERARPPPPSSPSASPSPSPPKGNKGAPNKPSLIAQSAAPATAGKGATESPSAPRTKKVTKYDTNVHKSKLLVRDETVVRYQRPEKPTLTRDDRKILQQVLEGNENVHIYDDNLLVLHQFRAANKSK